MFGTDLQIRYHSRMPFRAQFGTMFRANTAYKTLDGAFRDVFGEFEKVLKDSK